MVNGVELGQRLGNVEPMFKGAFAYEIEMPKGTVVDISRDRIFDVIESALSSRGRNEGFFGGEFPAPEVPFIAKLKTLALETGEKNLLLHGAFLSTTMLFLDSSTNQLSRLVKPEAFDKYNWLFDPGQVVAKSEAEVHEAVERYLRPNANREAVPFWYKNAALIVLRYGGDLNNYLRSHDFSAPALAKDLAIAKRKHPDISFHRFGPKIARLFLHWVQQYSLASEQLKDFHKIGIPIDFQIIRILVQTGAITLHGATPIGRILRPLSPLMEEICEEISRKHGVGVNYISQTLWLTGVRGCNELMHSQCPLAPECDKLISRDPFDSDSLVVPYDVGRGTSKARGKRIRYDKSSKTMIVEVSQKNREWVIEKGQGELPIW